VRTSLNKSFEMGVPRLETQNTILNKEHRFYKIKFELVGEGVPLLVSVLAYISRGCCLSVVIRNSSFDCTGDSDCSAHELHSMRVSDEVVRSRSRDEKREAFTVVSVSCERVVQL